MKTTKKVSKKKPTKKQKELKELLDYIELGFYDLKLYFEFILENEVEENDGGLGKDINANSVRWCVLGKKKIQEVEELVSMIHLNNWDK